MKWWEPSPALGLQPLRHHQTPTRLLLQYLEVPAPQPDTCTGSKLARQEWGRKIHMRSVNLSCLLFS